VAEIDRFLKLLVVGLFVVGSCGGERGSSVTTQSSQVLCELPRLVAASAVPQMNLGPQFELTLVLTFSDHGVAEEFSSWFDAALLSDDELRAAARGVLSTGDQSSGVRVLDFEPGATDDQLCRLLSAVRPAIGTAELTLVRSESG